MRPLRALDLCCGAGGVSTGLDRAGFEMTGVDMRPQPRYPFTFHQGDALDFPLEGFDLVAASPPCQAYSQQTPPDRRADHPQIIEAVRERLLRWGGVYLIENVPGAPLRSPVMLCGSSFGLGVRRHRMFESNVLLLVPECAHHLQPFPLTVTGGGPYTKGGNLFGWQPERRRKPRTIAEARAAMGIDYMTRAELNEAIPPAYTEHLGRQLADYCRARSSHAVTSH